MGRWVRWFGSQAATAPSVPRSGTTRVVTVSASEARTAARSGRATPAPKIGVGSGPRAASPTGILSAERLPAEVLTALLVQEGALSPSDEHACLQEHRATGRAVEEIVCESGLIPETELVAILSRRCKVPHLSLERFQVKPEVIAKVDAEFARANRLVPLEALGKVLNVATSNPLDLGALKRLEAETGMRVKPVLAAPSELAQALDKYYPAPEAAREEPAEDETPLTVRELLKDSWLGRIEEGKAGPPEEATAEAAQGGTGAGEPERLEPLPLSAEEARAFARASSLALCRAFAESAGVGTEEAELAAQPVSDAEFEMAAGREPLEEPPREEADELAKTSRSGRKKAARRKGRRKGGK